MIKKGILAIGAMIVVIIGYIQFIGSYGDAGEIICITNPENMGDTNQIRGIAQQLKKKNPNWTVKEISYKEQGELRKYIEGIAKKTKCVAISPGVYGIEALTSLTSSNQKIFKVHVSHQLLDHHDRLMNRVDMIVLPMHVVTDSVREKIKLSSTQLIETTGVCHNVTPSEIREEFEKHKDVLPNAQKYLVIILGGDAQMPDGKTWLQYRASESQQLAMHAIKRAQEKGMFILVLNGPRTGKHDESGKIDDKAHKGALDHVTKAFVDVCAERTQYIKLLDFQFDQPSLYKAALGAVLSKKGSEVWVPGESTSMVSETADMLDHVVVYEHGAMNATHKAHIESERKAGRIQCLQADGLIQTPAHKNEKSMQISASTYVAEKIGLLFVHANRATSY